jgi:hypothetical protein
MTVADLEKIKDAITALHGQITYVQKSLVDVDDLIPHEGKARVLVYGHRCRKYLLTKLGRNLVCTELNEVFVEKIAFRRKTNTTPSLPDPQ